jgi:hypothetical protein
MKSKSGLISILIIIVSASLPYATADTPNAIRVTGKGLSLYDARQDAVRQALQVSVQQLVVAQRVVQNDKLVLDKISSTMNGFVTRFTPIRVYSEMGQYVVEADVYVSGQRLENFLGSVKGSRMTVDSESILAAVQGELSKQKNDAEMIAAMLRDAPTRALEVGRPQLEIDREGSERIRFRAYVQWSPSFLRTLKQSLKQLGARRIRCTYDSGERECMPSTSSLMICFTKRFDGLSLSVRGSLRDVQHDCWRIAPSNLSPLGSPVGVAGVPWRRDTVIANCDEVKCVLPGRFAVVALADGKKLGLGRIPPERDYGVDGRMSFVIDWQKVLNDTAGYDTLTVMFNEDRVEVSGILAARDLEGVQNIDLIPVMEFVMADAPSIPAWETIPSFFDTAFPILRIRVNDAMTRFIDELAAEQIVSTTSQPSQ